MYARARHLVAPIAIACAIGAASKHIDIRPLWCTNSDMHPNHVDLHAGLYGLALVADSFDLGHGALLSRTYAHFMAPFMMAFAPAPRGQHHPGPWKAAKGGLYIDITTELFLPATTSVPQLDRMNTVWWIVALMRLHAASSISVPVISSERFASIPTIQQEPHLWPMEIHTPRETLIKLSSFHSK